MKKLKVKINWDAIGVTASLACAIHCALLPLALTSLPLFGINIIDNTGFEFFMIALAFCIGAYSLYHGWRQHHHRPFPLVVFSVGMVLLLAKQIWHQWLLWFLIPAVLFIVAAHYLNYRFCKKANHCHASDCGH